jgi:hypothetical protein
MKSLSVPSRRGYDISATVDGKMPPARASEKSYVADMLAFSSWSPHLSSRQPARFLVMPGLVPGIHALLCC